MLPSREKALAGLNYKPADVKEYVEETERQQECSPEKTVVEMWRMEAKRYTQVQVTYRGDRAILCLRNDLPSNRPEDIEKAIKDFYMYVDLEKTAVLKKASANDKFAKLSQNRTTDSQNKRDMAVNGRKLNTAEKGLTIFGSEGTVIVFKERLIQIFSYLKKRSNDESLEENDRNTFTLNEIARDIFFPLYENTALSRVTIQKKAAAHVRHMRNSGWIVQSGNGNRNTSIYSLVKNPFEGEMPAQAEPIDKEFIEKQKEQQRQALREV